MIYSFDSTMTGAPVLPGTVGAFRSLLKACLVDGFGAATVASLSVTGGIATATYSGVQHPFTPGRIGEISGSSIALLNGKKKVLTTSSTVVTFAAPGVPDGVATGSISSKAAAPGWLELFAGSAANVIALKSGVPEATGCVLRIDDTGTTNARVRAYESMSDVGTGLGATPLDSQVSGGLYWPKSGAATSAARPWFLVADERAFYFAVSPQGTDRCTVLFSGDIASLKSGDAYSFLATGNQSDQVATATVPDGCVGYSHRSARGGAFVVRSHTGIGQSIAAQRIGSHHTGSTADAYAGVAGYAWGAYPNGPNNGLMTGSLEVFAAAGMRGVLPGLFHPVQDCGAAFASGAIVDGTDEFAGRKLLAIRVAPPSGSATPGVVFLDITGPWSR